MLVNNINISSYGGTLLTREIQSAEAVVFEDWLSQSLEPSYNGKKVKYGSIKLQILIEAASDQLCLENISNLAFQLTKCIIKFDDVDFYYGCIISSKTSTKLSDGIHAIDAELKYSSECLAEVTETFTTQTKTLTIPGNLEIPAIVTITPAIGLGSVILSGFGKPITLKNLVGGTPIIIDGTACLVTANGVNKFADTEMWGFPSLIPGSNLISISQNGITCKVQYKPKFM